ncbi:MAG: bacillithiol system redox-active protein YtxJ [Planctomycetes bacterium]|nr:bacillithiol system redox-active protein YtxJ [Planctomycetota bacterium]
MAHDHITLPDDPAAAVAMLKAASADGPVVVFKKSPICPVSTMAEGEFQSWLGGRDTADGLKIVYVDVIAQRALARGLTAELGIAHQSPQVLVFKDGELAWHESHGQLTQDTFAREV